MLPNIRKVSKGPLGHSLRLLVLALSLVLVVAACGGPEAITPSLGTPGTESIATGPTSPAAPDAESAAPAPTTPAIPDMESVAHEPTVPATPDVETVAPELIPTPTAATPTERVDPTPIQSARPEGESIVPEPTSPATPETESVIPGSTSTYSIHPPAHYGAATPSVEERIYDSDVVIRASLQSSGTGFLRFRVIEYLKGTGPSDITVHASTFNRNTAWDDREAVLFLSMPEDQATSGASGAAGGAAAGEFVFTEAYNYVHPIYADRSKHPTGYTIDTKDPAWLPTEAEPGAGGATGESASDPAFITDSAAAAGGSSPTISLPDLRSKIAWVEGGEDIEDIEAYERCIRFSIGHRRNIRNWEAYYGGPWSPYQLEERMSSGEAKGTLLDDDHYRSSGRNLEYHEVWLSGEDADIFRTHIVDDDAIASNGFVVSITTVRPIPGGMYRFFHHVRPSLYWPCNYAPDESYTESLVTVTSPDSAAHEAFFDPVAIGGAVGADAANGVLKPASFSLTDAGSTASLSKIAWESGRATVELDPSLSLAGHHADFIALDGSVSLRLDFDDATETVAGTKRTLAWNVCAQPWKSGDLLMLRISSSGETLTGVTNDGPCN